MQGFDNEKTISRSHVVPSNVVKNQVCQLKEAPLCTLIVSFRDEQGKDVTSANVFTMKSPQLYPQTRKTVYKNEGSRNMSWAPTVFSSDDEQNRKYANSAMSSPLPNQLIQEISLSYSAPYTTSTKLTRYDSTTPPFSPYSAESDYKKIANPEPIPYFSSRSATTTREATPVSIYSPRTPRDTPTPRVGSALSQNLIISESTTFEEQTTITTSNNRARKKEKEMPTVNVLKQQFEAFSHEENVAPNRQRKYSDASVNSNGQRAKSKARIVIIDKSEKKSNYASNRPALVYSPGILTTTIVDIEPMHYGRRTEEYKIEEEYMVKKYGNNSYQYQNEQTQYAKEARQEKERNYEVQRVIPKETKENYEVPKENPVDTSPIDVVRNVIDRWETKIEEITTMRSHKEALPLRSVSRVDMNDNVSRTAQEKIYIQRSEPQPIEHHIPVIPLPPAVTEVTRLEEVIINEKHQKSSDEIEREITPTPQRAETVESTDLSEILEPQILTPSPTADIAEESYWSSEFSKSNQTTTDYSVAPVEIPQKKEEKVIVEEEKIVVDKEKIVVAEEKETKKETLEDKWKLETKTHETKSETEENVEHLHRFLERDYRIKTLEEWSSTRQNRASERPQTSNSYYSNRSTSVGRTRSAFENRMVRTYSEGRNLASGAYTSGFGGGLVSGMSSAGAICTTQIRDAREREKREIGLLNDRLADYIEKVRFLEAQNQCLSHDIDILRRGFSGGGHVSGLYDTEIAQAKRILEQTIAGRAAFDRDISALSADIEAIKQKWIQSVTTVKAHREDHDVDLDKLSKIEAEISLFKRKIRIVEEDVIRIRRENDGIYNEIARIKQLTHNEIALKNERSLNVQDLLQRIKLLQTENTTRIEQELVFIRRDTTAENRDYFRHELQAAIRDIRADYEAISIRNRNDIEVWYREQIRKIQSESTRVNPDLYKEELVSIRTTVMSVKSRLAEVEGRNFFLEKLIEDLRNNEESKMFEISLAEKDAQIARLREQCTELSIQMERLCDNEISLRAEIERYRTLLSGANVTTYVSNTHPASSGISVGGNIGTTRVISETTRTHSSSNTSYTGVPASRSGYTVGGNIGGISVGGTVGAHGASAHVSRGGAGSVSNVSAVTNVSGVSSAPEKKLDRIHDEKGVDATGRRFHSWYLGTISINQVTPSFIELKNICKIRRVDVGGFRIEQTVNGRLLGSAQINVPLILDPQEVVRFYHKHGKYLGQFHMDVDAFDNSTACRTSMYNYTEPQDERAWYVFLD